MYYRNNANLIAPSKLNDTDPQMYFVSAERASDDTFVLCVAHQQFRLFTLDTMPEDLKFIFAIIHVFDWNELLKGEPKIPEPLKDVGWMTSDSLYALVLPEKLLEELRGAKRIN